MIWSNGAGHGVTKGWANAPSWLVAENPTIVRGVAERTSDIATRFETATPCSQGRSPSTGRTARRQTDVPRIVCCAVDWVVTLPIREHYRHVGPAEYDSSRVCQTVHYEGVARRDPIPKGSDAPSRRKARDIVTFLDRHGHAEQRSGSILSLIQSPRTCPCGFKISDYYSIDFFIVAFDASDIMIE